VRLSQIATAERITLDPSVISTLISTSSGDLRRSITYLQSASRLSASTSPPTPITAFDIQEIAGVVPDAIIADFARVLGVESTAEYMDVDDGQRGVRGFERIKKKVKGLMREGYSASQILLQVSVFGFSKTLYS